MLSIEQFLAVMEQIPPSSTNRHGPFLYSLIRYLKPIECVEVGAWNGYSTAWMARALQENNRGILHVIDNFSLCGITEARLRSNLQMAGVDDYVTIHHGDSLDESLWPLKVDFAFLDGNHSYKYVNAEITISILRGATTICLHDTVSWWGPRRWIENFRKNKQPYWGVFEVPFDEGFAVLTFLEKKPPETYTEREHPSGVL